MGGPNSYVELFLDNRAVILGRIRHQNTNTSCEKRFARLDVLHALSTSFALTTFRHARHSRLHRSRSDLGASSIRYAVSLSCIAELRDRDDFARILADVYRLQHGVLFHRPRAIHVLG